MSGRQDPRDLWAEWKQEARAAAEERWTWLEQQSAKEESPRRQMSGKEWLKLLKTRLTRLEQMGLLGYRQAVRLREIPFSDLASSDQDRLRRVAHPRHLFALGLADEKNPAVLPLGRRTLRLNNGDRLYEGELSVQVFIESKTGRTVGMNIQIRGLDRRRDGQRTYLRYDLDVEQMGSGPVAHFRAHWHTGDDPDDDTAEDTDCRQPGLLLDPQDVIDVLVETFFPDGPVNQGR